MNSFFGYRGRNHSSRRNRSTFNHTLNTFCVTRHIIDRRNGDRVVPAVITFSSVGEMENIVGTRTYEIAARSV